MKQDIFYGYMLPGSAGVVEKLDLKDRKILYALSRNARVSSTAIAKAVRLSREVVDYRLKRLRERGLLTGVTTLVDTKRLDYIKHIIYFRLQDIDKEQEDDLAAGLARNPSVIWVALCSGSWDIGILVQSRSLQEFSSLFNELLAACKGHAYDSLILNEVKEDYLGLGLLAEGFAPIAVHDRQDISFQAELDGPKQDGAIQLSRQQLDVLNELIANPLAGLREISKASRLSVVTVKKLIGSLIAKRIIFGFMPMISLGKLGFQWYMTFLRFNQFSAAEERKLIEYMHQHPNILWYVKTIGPWQMEMSIFAKDPVHYREIITQLRSEFKSIRDYDSLLVFMQCKYLHSL
ncbi:Lrp/AsnC family transcriptional regulator [Candidatus Woesearchaeota archaeon]|nr:Lrp/AsnC family transcriptional regulator [Candidatus Woesearchaeota archaeon]